MIIRRHTVLSSEGPKKRPAIAAKEIKGQLRRILDNPEFIATDTQRKFLEFIVSETLAGKGGDIKGFTLATRVLGRSHDFDQANDPIVSMHASKLRRALERFYLTAGREDAVVIGLPKGKYLPTFEKRSPSDPHPATERVGPGIPFDVSRPCVLVKPFDYLGDNGDRAYLGLGLATELATELARYQELRVLQYDAEASGMRRSENGARFTISGTILEDAMGLKVIVRLTDKKTNEQIWNDTISATTDVCQIIAFQEQVARAVAAKLACEQGVISRRMSIHSSHGRPLQLSTYEALLRFYEYDKTLSSDSFLKAFEALEKARTSEPECGHVWCLLARLYASIYGLELPGIPHAEAERKAIEHAERAVALLPDDQRARSVLAYVRMLSDEVTAAKNELELAYNLNPHSLINLDGIGYIMTLLGYWERGPKLIRSIMDINPYYRHIVHYGLWVDALQRNDIEGAYQETMNLRIPSLFWYPLTKAASLGLLGRVEEAKRFATDLLELKPDFPDRGRRLISRYIKFDHIVQQVIKGLAAAGVTVR